MAIYLVPSTPDDIIFLGEFIPPEVLPQVEVIPLEITLSPSPVNPLVEFRARIHAEQSPVTLSPLSVNPVVGLSGFAEVELPLSIGYHNLDFTIKYKS